MFNFLRRPKSEAGAAAGPPSVPRRPPPEPSPSQPSTVVGGDTKRKEERSESWVQELEKERRERRTLEGEKRVLEARLSALEANKRNLVDQEARFREQLAEVGAQVDARDAECNQLRRQVEELRCDVLAKGSGMDRLQAELAAAHKESAMVRQRLRQLESDLSDFKRRNTELADQLMAKANETVKEQPDEATTEHLLELENNSREMEDKILRLEVELGELRGERDRFAKERCDMEVEREEEMKIVQEALEEAQEEKLAIQSRFEQDFERLRTVNTDREQQLLDDFEWKLREVEQASKRRVEERVRETRTELEAKLKAAEAQVAEMVLLRGTMHDQHRALRTTTRQMEQLQVSERMLRDEVARLRNTVDTEKSYTATLQSIHDKHVAEAERKLQTSLHEQKNEITAQWEERLRRDCSRLRTELQQMHSEEVRLAVDGVRCECNQAWDHRLQECLKEVAALKVRVKVQGEQHVRETESAQTNADRDILELRRKLDKMDLAYQEQIEQLQEKHDHELEHLQEEADRRVAQAEQSWQLQVSSTRATLELVKEQMERDAQNRMEDLKQQHHQQLELQWEQLTHDHEEALTAVQEQHRLELEATKQELEAALKEQNARETELAVVSVAAAGEHGSSSPAAVGKKFRAERHARKRGAAAGRTAGAEQLTGQSCAASGTHAGPSTGQAQGARGTAARGAAGGADRDGSSSCQRSGAVAPKSAYHAGGIAEQDRQPHQAIEGGAGTLRKPRVPPRGQESNQRVAGDCGSPQQSAGKFGRGQATVSAGTRESRSNVQPRVRRSARRRRAGPTTASEAQGRQTACISTTSTDTTSSTGQ